MFVQDFDSVPRSGMLPGAMSRDFPADGFDGKCSKSVAHVISELKLGNSTEPISNK